MKTKLTLLVDERVKRKARALSRRRNTSISAVFSEFIEREDKSKKDPFAQLDGIWEGRDVDAREIRRRVWKRS
ncbi:MAG TPA: DUF6364 family protein [Flavobacteriales bacterium]|nr:DUF6364 family protein [Flavobacteriales bacterium]HRD51058.1 DUF6364 family protein [Flavobacteriales bacterium]